MEFPEDAPETADSAEGFVPAGERLAESEGAGGQDPEEDAAAFAARMLGGFTGRIEPPRFSPFYQFSLLLVTCFMVVLPVLYVGLVALMGWLVLQYAGHFAWLLKPGIGGGRVLVLKWGLYFGILLAGMLATFFMVKPLFARRRERIHPLAINPGAEPVLYAFIARVCDLVKAPMPDQIALSSEVNASARLHGLFSSKLSLVIGLPLVAGLNLQQFAGVLAHEFGHFTQTFGLRLTYVIRMINHWFERVVYERDSWDEWLDELDAGSDGIFSTVVVALSRLFVWLSRLILTLLMYLGHGVSAYAMRQMEYGADEFQIKVAGSAAFETTMLRLQVLGLAEGAARHAMQQLWNSRQRLPADMIHLVRKFDESLPEESRSQLEGQFGLETTRWFHTHPSTAARIREARRMGEPGVFDLEWPATCLFQNFEVISRQVSLVHYRDEIGLPVLESQLIGGEEKNPAAEAPAAPVERPRIRLRVGGASSQPPPTDAGGADAQ